MTSFGAILDANVLYTAGPRDTLLRAAERGLYRPHWSGMILDEVKRNLIERFTKLGNPTPEDSAQYLLDEMEAHFPEAQVENFEALIPVMTNDAKDRHVLAAAIVGKAQVIVTNNLRDFPIAALQPYQVEAQSPDTFLTNLFGLYPQDLRCILTEQGQDLRIPRTLEQMLDSLAPQVPGFVATVRNPHP